MIDKPYEPSWAFLVVMWGTLTIIGGVQGYFTAEAIQTVLGWIGH